MAQKPHRKSARNSAKDESTSQYKKLAIALVILGVGVLAAILYLSLPYLTGKTVVLATLPVDPFDPLRGQYLTIRYEASSVPLPEQAKEGDTLYVPLHVDEEGIWRGTDALTLQPQNGVFLKGTLRPNRRLEFGIEQFFFERDAHFSASNLTVEAKVDGSGKARIVRLLQNGAPLNVTYRPVTLTT